MASTLKTLLKDAFELPAEDQLTLLLLLMERLSPLKTADELLTDEMKAELDIRIKFCEEHPEALIPMDEAHAHIRQMLHSRRRA